MQAIDEARFTLEVASYNFNLWSVRQALLRALRRESMCAWWSTAITCWSLRWRTCWQAGIRSSAIAVQG